MHYSKHITVAIITCVILEEMITNEYYVIAYDHLKLSVDIVLLEQRYCVSARSGSYLLYVNLDRNCAVHKHSRFHWSKITDIPCCAHVLSAQRTL